MSIFNYLPDDKWNKSIKSLIFIPSIFYVVAGTGIIGSLMGPLSLIIGMSGSALLYYAVLAIIISALLKHNRKKKVKAIIETYGNRYTEKDLNDIYNNDRNEFNRLFKLSSDEFFRKYVEEQSNHKKAQEIIVTMQQRIDDMYVKYNKLKEKEEKHAKEINELKREIELYEEILGNWKNIGGKLCLMN